MDNNYTREDWTLFRNMDTLPQKAGVPESEIPKLVAKELVDNALDISDNVDIAMDNNYFKVWNDGEGIPKDKIAELFSINRPMVSSKLLRLPTNRGALGNGLRVVMGAVIATGGRLFVSANMDKYEVVPQADGSSIINNVGESYGTGTLIEVNLGSKHIYTTWADDAVKFNVGDKYKGYSSGYWYNSESFYELLQASNSTVYELVTEFDGCTGTKASTVSKQFTKGILAKNLTIKESETLLTNIRENSKQVKPSRLGQIGELIEYAGYNCQESTFEMKSTNGIHSAIIPYKIEVFVKESKVPSCKVLINKSPMIKKVGMWLTGKSDYEIYYDGGLYFTVKATKCCGITININSPYMPITSDGKAPDLTMMKDMIKTAVEKAVGKYKRNIGLINPISNGKSLSQKAVILNHLKESIEKTGGGKYRFPQRNLFYSVRPFVMAELGKKLDYNYFVDVLDDYENENESIKDIYRDNRGSLYTPHDGTIMAVGTLNVEEYTRPAFTFNKVLYVEKEGFFEMLKDAKFPERYDIALLSSKGYASRATKDLIDLLADGTEDLQVFCIHDCDKAGTMIYQTLQEATKTRGKRKVEIINLGLDLQEAREMGLEIEDVEPTKTKTKAADYVSKEDIEFLKTHRVELNAMTTPQFISWLEGKMEDHGVIGKVIPEVEVLQEELISQIELYAREKVKERILRENNFEEQCKNEMIKLTGKIDSYDLKDIVETSLDNNLIQSWRNPINVIAQEIVIT